MLPYLLLDAGGTVLFPNHGAIRDAVRRHGHDVADDVMKHAMTDFIRHLDEMLRLGGPPVDVPAFVRWVLDRAGVDPTVIPAIQTELREMDRVTSLWSFTYPWVRAALDALSAMGCSMSIISNADGRVREELEQVDLLGYFEQVFDSALVGCAKPDERFFDHALSALALKPEQCVYVGDVFYIDVLGANRAGIAAIHLDPGGLYADWPGYRLPSIAELPGALESGLDLSSDVFFSLRGFV